jgi:hypothetical protein
MLPPHAWLQGLVSAEGAVLRQLSGSAAGSPWRVLLKEGEQFVQVGGCVTRPCTA